MPNYQYQARNNLNEISTGLISAENEKEARTRLEDIHLDIISISPSLDIFNPRHDSTHSFEFQAEYRTGNLVAGTIDAIDRDKAESRLRDEFHLKNIIIIGEKKIDHKPNKDIIHNKSINKKSHGRFYNFMIEIRSFIGWMLFFYLIYYYFVLLVKHVELGLPRDFFLNSIDDKLFKNIIVFLFISYLITNIYKYTIILIKSRDINNIISASSFLVLMILGAVRLSSMTLYILDSRISNGLDITIAIFVLVMISSESQKK